MSSYLEDVPDDVFGNILGHLDLDEVLRLQRLSKTLRHRIETFGIPLYLTNHTQSHASIYPPIKSWKPRQLIRYHHTINSSLRDRKWHAVQIGQTWRDSVIPTLNVSSSRIIFGTGGRILVHPLLEPKEHGGRVVGKSREYIIAKGKSSHADIIGLIDLQDELLIGQYDGTLQKFRFDGNGLKSIAHYGHSKGSNIHTMSGDKDLVATTTSHGLVSLFKVRSPWIRPDTFKVQDRAWSMLLSTRHGSLQPAIYLGMTGGIRIHQIRESGTDGKLERRLRGPEETVRSSAYDMTFPPTSSVHHPSMLLSSWFDSYLRIHDLRSPSQYPMIECFDPWQWADGSAIYSTTYLAENHIAGGGARHGTVSLFDIRMPKSGWSIFSPGGKGSPVYSLKGDGGRLWGVTEKRGFMVAFDGSGSRSEGMILNEARGKKEKAVEKPYKWNGRGGKWGWTVRYDQQDACSGYDHKQSGVALFDSLPVL